MRTAAWRWQRLRALGEAPSPLPAEEAKALLLQHSDAEESLIETLARSGSANWAIATGTPACVFALLLKAATGTRTLVGGLRPAERLYRLFDLCVFPDYHLPLGTAGKNVVKTLLPPAYHDGRGAGANGGTPFWLLALGGPAPDCPWVEAYLRGQMDAVIDAASKQDRRLCVAPGPRTPASLLDWLSRRRAERRILELAAPEHRPAALMQMAETVLITEDSESTLAEAINAGHCPGVLAVSDERLETKERLRERLEDWGLFTRPMSVRYAVRLADRRRLARRLVGRPAILGFLARPQSRRPRNWLFEVLSKDLRERISQRSRQGWR